MSYSGDPSSSGLDAVRFWAQDTGATGLLGDSEISYLISFTGLEPTIAPIEIAAIVADRIASKYAGEVSINSDGVSYSGDQLQTKYSELAKELRKTARTISGQASTPYVSGLGFGRQFGVGMSDNPEGSRQGLQQGWGLSGDTDWESDWHPTVDGGVGG